jgi:catechol 2,3-dioxygenase-like lactoylglutathione lyase family enzyme
LVARGFDHIAHAVRDLDAAADFYRRAGFIVSARNRHPPVWGTQNHLVQLPGCYIELLGLADMSATAPHGPRYFSFGAFARDFLAREQGLAMLALQGRGAPDAAEFRDGRLGDFELFEFAREGKRPDGTPVKLAFSLAFARDPKSPDVGFFTCLHHHPENFWNPDFQKHPNGASAVAGVVLVADNPSDHHIFLSAFTGERELLATSTGISINTPRGEIQVMTPAAFRDHFGTMPPATQNGARLAALRFAVRDLDAAQELFSRANLPVQKRMERLIVDPDTALGATLAFERI